MATLNSFGTRTGLDAAGRTLQIYSLPALQSAGFPEIARLPYSMKILLENLLRAEDGRYVKRADIEALARWDMKSDAQKEISFTPARVLLQDFTGVPCVVDLAAMRDGIVRLGGDPKKVNPLQPVELVIDHSVQVDYFGQAKAFELNAELEFSRNKERYAFLRWGQDAFRNFRVVPPDTGIVHQVNLEYLARVVVSDETADGVVAYPDTLVGTDSHTTMVNGLGVVGWGVGGIEAEAAMLGQPLSMLIPKVLGFKLSGRLSEGITATDLVLTITERLRKHGVVGKFVEFYGPGLAHLTLADRATLSNMCPEYGATIAIFPIDAMTLDYLRLTGREASRVALVEAYARAQGLFFEPGAADPVYSETIEMDLEHRRAQPRRPEAPAGSRPAQERQAGLCTGAARDDGGEEIRRRRRRGCGGAAAGRDRSRLGRDCRDHELHEHVEPQRDDWRRSGREEGCREGADEQAVGQDQSRAGLQGRHRLLETVGPRPVAQRARLQPCRLRMHHMHRQQRSAARRRVGGDRCARPGCRVRAERQPQLRGPRAAAGARQLPGLAAARRRLRARRDDEPWI